MPSILSIQADPADLAKMAERLNPRQLAQAEFQAVSRTTTKLATIVKAKVKEQSYIRPKYINAVVKAIIPKRGIDFAPEGKVVVTRKQLPITAFKYRASKRGGVTFQTGPDAPSIRLKHAFKATVRTSGTDDTHDGHVGIFLRARHLPTKGPNVGKGKLTKRGFAGRFAIEEVKGKSVAFYVSIPKIRDEIVFDGAVEMRKQLNSQFDRFTKPKS